MTLVSSIITDAYRESNMLPLAKVPNANQAAEALRLLNTILTAIYGGEAGEPLSDWPLGYLGRDQPGLPQLPPLQCLQQPPVNCRLIATNTAPVTVYLPSMPQDGTRYGIADVFAQLATNPVTLDANGRMIQGLPSLALNTDGLFQEWLYRADLGDWVPVAVVAMTDKMPFPAAYDSMFIIMLSMRLNPRYGRTMDPASAAVFKQNNREFVARYLQSAPLQTDDSISWPFMSKQSYGYGRAYASTSAFNRGAPRGDG